MFRTVKYIINKILLTISVVFHHPRFSFIAAPIHADIGRIEDPQITPSPSLAMPTHAFSSLGRNRGWRPRDRLEELDLVERTRTVPCAVACAVSKLTRLRSYRAVVSMKRRGKFPIPSSSAFPSIPAFTLAGGTG
jgi:hypothetical protein